MMRTKDWSTITLITICVATLTRLFSPVFCIYLHDLDDLTLKDKSTAKSSKEKLLDDIDDQLDADLMPPNFQPDPLLPIEDEENFANIGQQSNKERGGDRGDDSFNRYIGNVFDSLPEAKNIFDTLRLNGQNSPDGLAGGLSVFPPELLIPLLMDRRLNGDGGDDDDDDDDDDDEGQESKYVDRQETTMKMAKLILDTTGNKQASNKSDKSGSKDHGDKKLVGKLSLIKSLPTSSTTLKPKDTTVRTKTGKPNDPKEGKVIDEMDEVNGDDDEDENEGKSKKLTTRSGKSKNSHLFKWWSKSKSTTPKSGQKGQGTTISTVLSRLTTTTEKPEPGVVDEDEDEDEDDDDEDDDLSLTSSNSTTASTVSPLITSKSSTTFSSSTTQSSNHGKSKSTTKIPTKSTKFSTTSSTTSKLTKSDLTSQKLTTNDSTSSLTTTMKTKHPKVSSSAKPIKTEENEDDNDDDDDDDDDDKINETIGDPIDTFLSSLNGELEQSKDDKKVTSSTTINLSTKLEGKQSHRHDKTTLTTSTPKDTIKSSTIKSDSRLNKKLTFSTTTTTKEPETNSTIKSTINSNDDDIFPIISVTRSKTNQEESTKTTTTTLRPSLTTLGHKTTRHRSTSSNPKSATTTRIPTLHPYVEDSEDIILPNWNPDVFP